MWVANIIKELVLFIPRFWDTVFNFFREYRHLPQGTPQWILDLLDPMSGSAAKMVITIIIYIAIYLCISFFIAKTMLKMLQKINGHMQQYGYSIIKNIGLNVAALVFLGLEAFDSAVARSPSDDGYTITMFAVIAALLVLIGVVRALILAKHRALYFLPLQLLVFAFFYLVILLAFPAVLIASGLYVTGHTMSSMGQETYRCRRCNRTFESNVARCPYCG